MTASITKIPKNFKFYDLELIEKYRQESNFKRLQQDILPPISANCSKTGGFLEILANFYAGECFLEIFSTENKLKPDISNKELF
uniref:Uncharacterized protein n=1 Tax=Romanomermis culicivorax TaxID=13658 RepID=A0A915IBR0_ROMCU